MSLAHQLAILSAVINIAGTYAYLRDTLRGITKPNKVSFTLWALAPLIGFAAARDIGADGWVNFRVFLAGFLPLLILLASFVNPKSYWKLTMFDLLCGLLSLIAIVVWTGIDSPRTAIMIVAIGDGLAALPTIKKSWTNPETETGITYIAFFISSILILPSIPTWNIENATFPLFLLGQNLLLTLLIYRKHLHVQ